MNIRELMTLAEGHLNDDPHLANYILRDAPEVSEAGLNDLAWAMHRDGSLHRNDVMYLLSQLCEYLDGIGQ